MMTSQEILAFITGIGIVPIVRVASADSAVEAVEAIYRGGYVKASYGRKQHLRAIWLRPEDGSSPVPAHAPSGTRYSFPENLDSGRRCWKHRRLDRRDEDGVQIG